jgi:hypothetical protein
MTPQHIYESTKGIDFLSWNDWALSTLSPEELDIYFEDSDMSVGMSKEKIALYSRWVIEEKITKHTIIVDGVVVLTEDMK